MEFSTYTLRCEEEFKGTKRENKFRLIKVSLDRNKDPLDVIILNRFIKFGNNLSKDVNSTSANKSDSRRNSNTVLANCIAGLLAEFFWKTVVNLFHKDLLVSETEYESSENQIDLISIKKNLKLEVRSSFPRNGIGFAICHPSHQFDILGPYNNSYKPSEPEKDIYLRTLFHVDSHDDFLNRVNNTGIDIYLTGGATWEMMFNDKISLVKTLAPEDSVSNISSDYRVVPFQHALDTFDIIKKIVETELASPETTQSI